MPPELKIAATLTSPSTPPRPGPAPRRRAHWQTRWRRAHRDGARAVSKFVHLLWLAGSGPIRKACDFVEASGDGPCGIFAETTSHRPPNEPIGHPVRSRLGNCIMREAGLAGCPARSRDLAGRIAHAVVCGCRSSRDLDDQRASAQALPPLAARGSVRHDSSNGSSLSPDVRKGARLRRREGPRVSLQPTGQRLGQPAKAF